MRLISVTVRNYRVHQEQTVHFDRSRTLIGGPNEVGKSTLVEAIHRCLFLKSKGSSEYHRVMTSSHGGHPEVDLQFEAAGQSYFLKKRFGPTGTTTLAPSNSVSISGDAAETELARILNVENGVTGKVMLGQWSHLWIWQSEAGSDPAIHATSQKDALVSRLRNMGASAILQSDLDARIAARYSQAVREIFSKKNMKPKANSELDVARRNVDSAGTERDNAQRRVDALWQSAVDFESATRDFAGNEKSLNSLKGEQEGLKAREICLRSLRKEESLRQTAVDSASRNFTDVNAAYQQTVSLRGLIKKLEWELQPENEEVFSLTGAFNSAKQALASAEQEYRNAANSQRYAELRHDFAEAARLVFEISDEHSRLENKVKDIKHLQQAVVELETTRATLADVDDVQFRGVRKLESDWLNAQTAMEAMAAGLEVLSTNGTLLVNGQPAVEGQQSILTTDTDIQVGTEVRFRITPGGGTTLAEARHRVQAARDSLQRELDQLVVKSVTEAEDACSRRRTFTGEINTLRAELDGMDADCIEEKIGTLKTQLDEATFNALRRSEQVPEISRPADKAAAVALLQQYKHEFNEARNRQDTARILWDQNTKHTETTGKTLSAKQDAIRGKNSQLAQEKMQLASLVDRHGEDEQVKRSLETARECMNAANGRLKETSDAISVLQPDLLDSDLIRIQRSIDQKQEGKLQLCGRIEVAKAALRSDGYEDPKATLAMAEARFRIASDHCRNVERKANAVAKLDKLFQDEQRSLAEQFTQPLAEKITGYLQCLFGPGAQAIVKLESNAFTGLELVRAGFGDSVRPFAELSGGAKEQVAAAVRLAMAEVLAADHDHCLPVVFDDAFAYSDPVRVHQLQRMLDLAAVRGLQIIVLTCNSEDYAALGATTIHLQAPAASVQRAALAGQKDVPYSYGATALTTDKERFPPTNFPREIPRKYPASPVILTPANDDFEDKPITVAGAANPVTAQPIPVAAPRELKAAGQTPGLVTTGPDEGRLIEQLRSLGGTAAKSALRKAVGMSIGDFYNLLQDLLRAERIQEDQTKTHVSLTDDHEVKEIRHMGTEAALVQQPAFRAPSEDAEPTDQDEDTASVTESLLAAPASFTPVEIEPQRKQLDDSLNDAHCDELLHELRQRNGACSKPALKQALGWSDQQFKESIQRLLSNGRIREDRTGLRVFLMD